MDLRQTFIELVGKYSKNTHLSETLWHEIEQNYTNKKRFYHTLSHLENLYHELIEVKEEIEDWDTILFSVYYHDIIYKTTKNNNEEKSAELAKERLQLIKFPNDKISKCVSQIIATKQHLESTDLDTNLFTDADLSILGKPRESYSEYFKQIRKEYSQYPNFIYNPGRKNVLNHFLSMERIFKTDSFFNKYENIARQNLANELKQF